MFDFYRFCLYAKYDDELRTVFDANDSFPVDSVIYHWYLPYFYYGRTRPRKNGMVRRLNGFAHLQSPLTLAVTRLKWDELTKKYEKKTGKVKGALLQPL
jgi:hypothetical protein